MKTKIYDVTLRDGIMSQPLIENKIKVEYVNRMFELGIRNFELVRFPIDGSYPQFEKGLAFLKRIQSFRQKGATFAVFAMGIKGIEQALKEVALFDELHTPGFISDSYGQYAFTNWSWKSFISIVKQTREQCRGSKLEVTVGLGTCFGCPIDLQVPQNLLKSRLEDLNDCGISTIMFGDTAGTASPDDVRRLTKLMKNYPSISTRFHFHNTFGRALLNSITALETGASGIDCSLLGLGGESHPYFAYPQNVNNGNCALEELYPLLETGSEQITESLYDTARWFADHVNFPAQSRASYAQLVKIPGSNRSGAEYKH